MRPRFCSRSEKIPACVQRCAAGILNYPRNQQPRQFTLAGFFFAGYESVVRSDSAVLGSAAVFLRLAPHAVHVGLFISPRAARDPREKRLTAATGLTAFLSLLEIDGPIRPSEAPMESNLSRYRLLNLLPPRIAVATVDDG